MKTLEQENPAEEQRSYKVAIKYSLIIFVLWVPVFLLPALLEAGYITSLEHTDETPATIEQTEKQTITGDIEAHQHRLFFRLLSQTNNGK